MVNLFTPFASILSYIYIHVWILNTDPIRIRIHNTRSYQKIPFIFRFCFVKEGSVQRIIKTDHIVLNLGLAPICTRTRVLI